MDIIPKKTEDFKLLSTVIKLLSVKNDSRPHIRYFFSDSDGSIYKTDGRNLCQLLIDYDVPALSFIDVLKNQDSFVLRAVTSGDYVEASDIAAGARKIMSGLSDRAYIGSYKIDKGLEKPQILDAISYVITTMGIVLDFMLLYSVMHAMSSVGQEFTISADKNGVLVSSPRFNFYTSSYRR